MPVLPNHPVTPAPQPSLTPPDPASWFHIPVFKFLLEPLGGKGPSGFHCFQVKAMIPSQ